MEWKPILTYKWNAWALGMIDDISRCIMRQDLTARAQGLLYGNAGTDVYLFHAADLKNDDKLFDWATDLLGLILKQVEIKIKHVPQKTDVIDVSLGQGLAGVGWSMSYLLNSERVEGDMNSIFGAADAAIFRRMVTIVLEPLLQELSSSVGIVDCHMNFFGAIFWNCMGVSNNRKQGIKYSHSHPERLRDLLG